MKRMFAGKVDKERRPSLTKPERILIDNIRIHGRLNPLHMLMRPHRARQIRYCAVLRS